MSSTKEMYPPLYSTLAADPVLKELVAEFVAEMPIRIVRIRRQFVDQDWQALSRTAHQLRGAAGSYGFIPVSPSAHRLEELLKNGADPKTIASAVQELIALCQSMTAGTPK